MAELHIISDQSLGMESDSMPMPDDDHDMPMPDDDPGMPMPDDEPVSMNMYLYQSHKVNYLFSSYVVDSRPGYFGVCMVALAIGFVTEALSIYQDRLDQQISSKITEEKQKMRALRCSQGLVFVARMFFSYLCMLSVMTYNIGIIFCIIGGLGAAYFIFGF